ncbi:MAG: hypothetical protein K2K60_00135 [Clostridia bacterium]|nr:hypothetical protein [Clostridia bacterium]
MSNWSKLQKELYKLIDSRIDFQIHCVAYRMKSQHGNTSLPRYFITFQNDIIFDYPKQFTKQASDQPAYPYENDITLISETIREYVDTPLEHLLDKNFQNDKWHLTEILKAADRRIGQRRLDELLLKTTNENARKIIELRKSL